MFLEAGDVLRIAKAVLLTGKKRQMVTPLTLEAAPPLMIDFTKIPRSAWFSFDRLPLTLTPSPAEPESLSGTSNVRNSLVPSGVRTRSSSSAFCQEGINTALEKTASYLQLSSSQSY